VAHKNIGEGEYPDVRTWVRLIHQLEAMDQLGKEAKRRELTYLGERVFITSVKKGSVLERGECGIFGLRGRQKKGVRKDREIQTQKTK